MITFKVGQKVATKDLPDLAGVVESVDEEDNIVWVGFPVRDGVIDMIDVDPGDLVAIDNFAEAPERAQRYRDEVEESK